MNSPTTPGPVDTESLYVLDVSVLVDGRISEEIDAGDFASAVFVVPEAVLGGLAAHARVGRETGFTGLSELRSLQRMADDGQIRLRFEGDRPSSGFARIMETGDIQAAASRLATGLDATLVTSDRVQALAAEARGIRLLFFGTAARDVEGLRLMQYFDDETMSVHLRAQTRPKAKKGSPGEMTIVPIRDDKITEREIEVIAREIIETAEQHPEGFIEADSGGSTVVQLTNLRIAIARPPFSDALEITAVRPVAHTTLEDYAFADLLRERFSARHRGVLVAGSPGAGKSTFVQAVADYLEGAGWVIKTMEKPRDLVVSDEITQYTALDGDMANTGDVLLLVRPDYTIFDEMRRTPDFHVFGDLRLAGVGMIGVVHATRGIDALQRLIGRVELGMIPQIVDTVVYIDGGEVREVYEVEATVKMPTGLGDEGLARPVVEVRNFETSELAFEIYTFGEQVVVMPIGEVERQKPVWQLAAKTVEHELRREVRGQLEVRIDSDNRAIVYVRESDIGAMVGRGGANVRALEDRIGMSLDIRSLSEMGSSDMGREIDVHVTDDEVVLELDPSFKGRTVDVSVDGRSVFVGAVSRRGDVSLRRGTRPAEELAKAAERGRAVRAQRM